VPVGDGVFVVPETLFGAYLVQVAFFDGDSDSDADGFGLGIDKRGQEPGRVVDPGRVGADPAGGLDVVVGQCRDSDPGWGGGMESQ
jgi:hypothetical protein